MVMPAPSSAKSSAMGNQIGLRWAALAGAGTVIGMLAGQEPEKPSRQIRDFPASLRDCDGWRRDLAAGGIDDFAAIVEAGLAALLAVNARGMDCHAAAQALWQEYVSARSALLALLPPGGQLGPLRAA